MQRYGPVTRDFEVPYVPEAFLSAVTDAANNGDLFDRPRPVRVVAVRREHDCLRVRVLDEAEALVLRFDCLDVWRIDDHTIRLRVAYRGWFRARMRDALDFGFWHVLAALFIGVILLLAAVMPESLACWPFPLWGDGEGSGDEPRPQLRVLGKRLKEIASALPA